MMALSFFLLAATAASSEIVQRQSRMKTLYDEVCIKAFPNDEAVDALMVAKGATRLTTDEVKVTLNDDPGRGWEIKDGNISALVILELPPYHACSVRWPMPEYPDVSEYRAIADKYQAAKGGFEPIAPYDADYDDIHVHAVGEQRTLADGGTESLFIFDQYITDPKRRTAGETGIMFRFVHQFTSPGAK